MEWNTVFETQLSYFDNCKKVAKILFGNGTYKKENTERKFSLIRLDIRFYKDNEAGLGISLSPSEFVWLVSVLNLKLPAAQHNGKRILVLNQMVNQGEIAISTIENGKIFGITLTNEEITTLMSYKEPFAFLLKNYNISGEKLRKFAKDLYIDQIGRSLNTLIKNDCIACRDSLEHVDNISNLCGKYLQNILSKKDYVDETLAEEVVDNEYLLTFNALATYLNVKPSDKLEIMQILIPTLKNDKQELIKELIAYRDIGLSDSKKLNIILEKVRSFIKF